ncbi:hypothetical protein ZWY2020_032640 [Hordeum vulgare]|nr:hypothetical protein ZWY2020_032640 [Hordeum vulgare]
MPLASRRPSSGWASAQVPQPQPPALGLPQRHPLRSLSFLWAQVPRLPSVLRRLLLLVPGRLPPSVVPTWSYLWLGPGGLRFSPCASLLPWLVRPPRVLRVDRRWADSTFAAATLLSGHPAHRPVGAICYLPRSAELVAAELDLERALLASVAGRRLGITCELVYNALGTHYGLAAHEFFIHIHADDDFLIKFSSAASRARVTAGGLRTGGFRLLFTPWSRSHDAVPVKARFLVSIEITGIPDHAWHRSSAEFLLSLFCWVENLAPETRDASDMSVFRLTAWTTNPMASRARRSCSCRSRMPLMMRRTRRAWSAWRLD